MTTEEANKRRFFVPGQPVNGQVFSRENPRRQEQFVYKELESPEQNIPTDFFEFDEELSEAESARKLFEKTEIDKIKKAATLKEKQKLAAPIPVMVTDEKSGNEDSFFSFSEETDENEQIKIIEPIKPIIKNDIIIADTLPTNISNDKQYKIKLCKFIKADGNGCKRQAPNSNDYCKVHIPK